MKTRWLPLTAATLCLSCAAMAQQATPTLAQASRQVSGTNNASVMRFKSVLAYSYDGDDAIREENNEGVATIIDPSGTAIVDYELIAYSTLGSEDGGPKSVKLTSAELILADGTSVPVEVVAKDAELELALISPKTALSKPLPCVKFNTTTAISLGDTLLTIGRMPAAAKNAVQVLRMTVCSSFENPRLQYVFEEGCDDVLPVFTQQGELVGMTADIAAGEHSDRKNENGMYAASEIVKFLTKAKSASVKVGENL